MFSFFLFLGTEKSIRLEWVHWFFVLLGFWFSPLKSPVLESGRPAISCVVSSVHMTMEMLI